MYSFERFDWLKQREVTSVIIEINDLLKPFFKVEDLIHFLGYLVTGH